MVLIYIYSQMKMLFVTIFRHIGIDSIHRIAAMIQRFAIHFRMVNFE